MMACKETERHPDMQHLMEWLKTHTPQGEQPLGVWIPSHCVESACTCTCTCTFLMFMQQLFMVTIGSIMSYFILLR